MTLRVAMWIARGLALGWMGNPRHRLALPGGHPPLVFVVGYAVVLASFVLAPVRGHSPVTRASQDDHRLSQSLGTEDAGSRPIPFGKLGPRPPGGRSRAWMPALPRHIGS